MKNKLILALPLIAACDLSGLSQGSKTSDGATDDTSSETAKESAKTGNGPTPSSSYAPYAAFLGSNGLVVNNVIAPRYGNNMDTLNDVEQVRLIATDPNDPRKFNLRIKLTSGVIGDHCVNQGPSYTNFFSTDTNVKPSAGSSTVWAVIGDFMWVNGYVARMEMCLYTSNNSGVVATNTCKLFEVTYE